MTYPLRSLVLSGVVALSLASPAFGLGIPLDLDWKDLAWEGPSFNRAGPPPSVPATDFAHDFGKPDDEHFPPVEPGRPDGLGKPGDDDDDDGKPGDDDDDDGKPGDDDGDHGKPGDDHGKPDHPGGGVGHDEHGNGNGFGHCKNDHQGRHPGDSCGKPVPEPGAALLMGALVGALALVRRRS